MNEAQINFILIYLVTTLPLYGIHVFFSNDSKLISYKNIKIMIFFSLMITSIIILPYFVKPILSIVIHFLIIYVFFEATIFQSLLGTVIVLLISFFSEFLGIIIASPFITVDFSTPVISSIERLILSSIILLINVSILKISKKRVRYFISSKSILKKHQITISITSIFFIFSMFFLYSMLHYDTLNLENQNILLLFILFISWLGLSYIFFKIDSILKKSITDNPSEVAKEIIPGRVLINGRLLKTESITKDSI